MDDDENQVEEAIQNAMGMGGQLPDPNEDENAVWGNVMQASGIQMPSPDDEYDEFGNLIDGPIVGYGAEDGQEVQYASRIEATTLVKDAAQHDPLLGDDLTAAQQWYTYGTTQGNNTTDLPDMLDQADQSVPLRDALIGALWPEGYVDPNNDIPFGHTSIERDDRLDTLGTLRDSLTAQTPKHSLAVLLHTTALLASLQSHYGDSNPIAVFKRLASVDIEALEEAHNFASGPTADMISLYLDLNAVAKVTS